MYVNHPEQKWKYFSANELDFDLTSVLAATGRGAHQDIEGKGNGHTFLSSWHHIGDFSGWELECFAS